MTFPKEMNELLQALSLELIVLFWVSFLFSGVSGLY